MSDYGQRIADELEQAWLDGEIGYADACAELDAFDEGRS